MHADLNLTSAANSEQKLGRFRESDFCAVLRPMATSIGEVQAIGLAAPNECQPGGFSAKFCKDAGPVF
jgi:hypothetical protein